MIVRGGEIFSVEFAHYFESCCLYWKYFCDVVDQDVLKNVDIPYFLQESQPSSLQGGLSLTNLLLWGALNSSRTHTDTIFPNSFFCMQIFPI